MGWADTYIADLESGRTVKCRPRGNSMTPRIRSGQLCTIDPASVGDVRKGDVVLCRVGGAQYLHFADQVAADGRVRIVNAHGRVNGWTRHVYGRLTGVED